MTLKLIRKSLLTQTTGLDAYVYVCNYKSIRSQFKLFTGVCDTLNFTPFTGGPLNQNTYVLNRVLIT